MLDLPRVIACILAAWSALFALDSARVRGDHRPGSPSTAMGASTAFSGPRFRVGNAAAPFGWSTVVGDFNTDGAPDVAVADHFGRASGGYAYRLEFSLSGQTPRHVIFESTQGAIDLRLADVDRDDDLDLVVGAPLSGETLAVWLNDGQGHFTPGNISLVPPLVRSSASLKAPDSPAAVDAAEWLVRSSNCSLPKRATGLPLQARPRVLPCSPCPARSLFRDPEIAPRAPPASFSSLLS